MSSLINKVVKIHLQEKEQVSVSAILVQEANKYKCHIDIIYKNRKINAKSLMGVLSIPLANKRELTLIADGPDEALAIETLSDLLSSNPTNNCIKPFSAKKAL